MTLEEAVSILNLREHCGAEWEIFEADGKQWAGNNPGRLLRPFEAIAIAEKYERERADTGETP